jgi:hypothetical protein
MADTPEEPQESESPEPPPTPPKKAGRGWRRALVIALLTIVVIPVLIFSLWAWVALGWVYSTGDRAGYIQKLSKKGWLCKTWEGELAMIPPPGTVTPQLFSFTVRNDSLANILERDLGKRVSLTYEQHRGIPTSCFGETEYFITNVRILPP